MKIVPVKFEDVFVGDIVYKQGPAGFKNNTPLKVLAKHQGENDSRQYIVAAFKGDIPISYTPYQLGKEYKPVVKTATYYGNAAHDTTFLTDKYMEDTHKITYKIVDGEVDCNSVKMEKL